MRGIIFTVLIIINICSKAQFVTIPDVNFRNKLMQLYPGCFNGNQEMDTTCSDIVNETFLDVSSSNILSVVGVQYFDSLDSFWCSANYITHLTKLPQNLTALFCSQSNLLSLPPLPNKIKYLTCTNNNLHSLPILPDSLLELNCQNNQLTFLPSLPGKLYHLYCQYNPLLKCLPLLPNTLMYFNAPWGTQISCFPNAVNGNTWGYPLCPIGSECEPSPSASGTIYHDLNNNGVMDAGEEVIKNMIVTNNSKWSSSSDNNGDYLIKLDSGTVNNFKCNTDNFNFNPLSYSITPTALGNQGTNFDFAVTLIPNIYDLKVYMAKGRAVPGFNQWVNTIINNEGTENAINATVKLLKPNNFTFINSTPVISQQIGDTLMWNNVNINIFKNKTFKVEWQIPANITIGTHYSLQAWVIPSNTDTTPFNNYINDDGTVFGSFDPNEKTVSKNTIDENAIDEILYTVYFQNTGTDTAFNITIQDQLSSNLDLSTFQMIGASHNYTYQIRDKGLLEVFFQNVLLPDSNVNEPLSHGFFQYVIKSKPNLTINDSINNTASIYFDFNAPIVTNTVTTKVIVTGMSEVSKINANVYPNPTTGKAIVSISESSGTLTLSDMKGCIISVNSIKNGSEIDLSRLESGIYIGKIETEKGFKVLKIVKQD